MLEGAATRTSKQLRSLGKARRFEIEGIEWQPGEPLDSELTRRENARILEHEGIHMLALPSTLF